jgi:hypothetical protein
VFDDGSGPALYVAGSFTSAGGVSAPQIAKWNGSIWSAAGFGISGATIHALTVFDDGSGPKLYAAGGQKLWRWSGSTWSLVSSVFGGGIEVLAVFDDGSGPKLYAAGSFTITGGISTAHIARWNGAGWSALGLGVNDVVNALTVFDDGTGPALYVGGFFAAAGGMPVNGIARWNGTTWSAVGTGESGVVDVLTVFDDGHGAALYAGGNLALGAQAPLDEIARWDGTSWSFLGQGTGGLVNAMTTSDDGNGPALFVGGDFSSVPDSGDRYIAKWGNPAGCGTPGVSICQPGVGGVIACPCSNNPPASGPGCDNSAHTGGATLSATGIARISFDSVVLTSHGERSTATSIVLQGDGMSSSGVVFGQGVRCVAGALKRLYVKTASAGSITAPQGTDLHVHARSAALGDTIAPGTHRYYGVYYRDPTVLGGCPASSTFNITQQLDVLWGA